MIKEIHTGGDPRNFLEFSEIRNEINKMNNPLAGYVDYEVIDKNALILFKKNGVDLHTAVYFTLARTKLYGMQGAIEGSDIIASLIQNSWETMWPENHNARIDMLDWLNSKIGHDIRQLKVDIAEIPQLQELQQPLTTIINSLIQHQIKKGCRLTDLLTYVTNTKESLEKKRQGKEQDKLYINNEVLIYQPKVSSKPQESNKKVAPKPKSVSTQPPVKVKTEYPNKKRPLYHLCFGFFAGILCSCLCVTLSTKYLLNHYDITSKEITDSLHHPLTSKQLDDIASNIKNNIVLSKSYQPAYFAQQLNQVMSYPPLAKYYYGENIITLSEKISHEHPLLSKPKSLWNHEVATQRSDQYMKKGYFYALSRLKALSDELNNAEKENRYITISYLKSNVYQIRMSLMEAKPIEELLRELESENTPTPGLIKQINDRFNSLLSNYYWLNTMKTQHEY